MSSSTGLDASLLNKWSSRLKQLESGNEKEFHSVSSKLAELRDASKRASDSAASIADYISGSETSSAIRSLNGLIMRIESQINESSGMTKQRIDRLKSIIEFVRKVRISLVEFKNITKNLKAVSMATKIQCASVKSSGSGFLLLAHEIKKLSDSLDTKTTSIYSRLERYGNIARDTHQTLLIQEKEKSARFHELISESRQALESLTARYRLSHETTVKIKGSTIEIAGQLSDIVPMLQFHDGTRQQFENSRKLMESVAQRLDASDSQYGLKPEAISGQLREVYLGLSQTRRQFDDAFGSVQSNLRSIGDKAGGICVNSKLIGGAAYSNDLSFIKGVELDLLTIDSGMSALYENDEANLALTHAIGELASINLIIRNFMKDTENIDKDIKLMSINSALEAFKMGGDGAALGVISTHINSMAESLLRKTAALSKSLENVYTTVASLETSTQEQEDARSAESRKVAGELSGLIRVLHDINDKISTLYAGLDSSLSSISNDVKSISDKMKAGREVDIIISEITNGIMERESGLSDSAGHSTQRSNAAHSVGF